MRKAPPPPPSASKISHSASRIKASTVVALAASGDSSLWGRVASSPAAAVAFASTAHGPAGCICTGCFVCGLHTADIAQRGSASRPAYTAGPFLLSHSRAQRKSPCGDPHATSLLGEQRTADAQHRHAILQPPQTGGDADRLLEAGSLPACADAVRAWSSTAGPVARPQGSTTRCPPPSAGSARARRGRVGMGRGRSAGPGGRSKANGGRFTRRQDPIGGRSTPGAEAERARRCASTPTCVELPANGSAHSISMQSQANRVRQTARTGCRDPRAILRHLKLPDQLCAKRT